MLFLTSFDLALVGRLLKIVADPNAQQSVEPAPLSHLIILHADGAGDISLAKDKGVRELMVVLRWRLSTPTACIVGTARIGTNDPTGSTIITRR